MLEFLVSCLFTVSDGMDLDMVCMTVFEDILCMGWSLDFLGSSTASTWLLSLFPSISFLLFGSWLDLIIWSTSDRFPFLNITLQNSHQIVMDHHSYHYDFCYLCDDCYCQYDWARFCKNHWDWGYHNPLLWCVWMCVFQSPECQAPRCSINGYVYIVGW